MSSWLLTPKLPLSFTFCTGLWKPQRLFALTGPPARNLDRPWSKSAVLPYVKRLPLPNLMNNARQMAHTSRNSLFTKFKLNTVWAKMMHPAHMKPNRSSYLCDLSCWKQAYKFNDARRHSDTWPARACALHGTVRCIIILMSYLNTRFYSFSQAASVNATGSPSINEYSHSLRKLPVTMIIRFARHFYSHRKLK